MVKVNLKYQTIKELVFKVTFNEEESELSIEHSHSFNVEYNEDNTRSFARLKYLAKENAPDPRFEMLIEVFGAFECFDLINEDDKKMAHVLAYYQLFPYVQSMCSYLTTNAGFPALVLEKQIIDPDNVNIIEK